MITHHLDSNQSIKSILHDGKKTIVFDPAYIYFLPQIGLSIKRQNQYATSLVCYGIHDITEIVIYKKVLPILFGFRLSYLDVIDAGVHGQLELEIINIFQFIKHFTDENLAHEAFQDKIRVQINALILSSMIEIIKKSRDIKSLDVKIVSNQIKDEITPRLINDYGISISKLIIQNQPFIKKEKNLNDLYRII
jgi:hypothetical protein